MNEPDTASRMQKQIDMLCEWLAAIRRHLEVLGDRADATSAAPMPAIRANRLPGTAPTPVTPAKTAPTPEPTPAMPAR